MSPFPQFQELHEFLLRRLLQHFINDTLDILAGYVPVKRLGKEGAEIRGIVGNETVDIFFYVHVLRERHSTTSMADTNTSLSGRREEDHWEMLEVLPSVKFSF
jgi:hypothetical protein